ncbi:hypothetical protein [Sorangium sp. So ce362]
MSRSRAVHPPPPFRAAASRLLGACAPARRAPEIIPLGRWRPRT